MDTPEPSATGRSTPVSPIETATILEDAADIILIRGVRRDGQYGYDGQQRCTVGAVAEVCGADAYAFDPEDYSMFSAFDVARRALYRSTLIPDHDVIHWNDFIATDDEVRDTLLLVAKELRGIPAVAS